MIHNLRDFLRLLGIAYKRRPVGLTQDEFDSIRARSNDSPLFSEQVQRYLAGDPKPYARLSARAMAQERIRAYQGMGNVHDPLLAGPRLRTKEWLEEQKFFLEKFQGALSEIYPAKQAELLSWVHESVLKPEDKAVLQTYIPFFFDKYSGGATGALNLFRAMAWADLVPQGQLDDRSEKQKNLLGGLLEAAKAYEGEATKYYAPQDYSCMPGLDERVLDVMTGVRLSLELPVALKDQSPQKRYIAASIDPFVAAKNAIGPKPTELFYALYLHARYPEGFTIETQPAAQIQLYPKDSEQYTEALSDYKKKIEENINRYRIDVALNRIDRSLESLLRPYFQIPTEDEKTDQNPLTVLEGDALQEAISQKFESLYERYQGQVFTGHTVEQAQKLPIPESLQGLVESQLDHSCFAIQPVRESELEDSKAILQEMSLCSGLEADFLESLCRMSGGLEDSLLGAFEAQTDRGDGVSKELCAREGLGAQIRTILQKLNRLHNALAPEDRAHSALTSHFQVWLATQIRSMNASDAAFIASEEQYLRILKCIAHSGGRNCRLWRTEVGESLLFLAVEQGKTKFVRHVLSQNPAQISVRDRRSFLKETLLHRATSYGHKDMTEFLIQCGGADLYKMQDSIGNTGLHWALQQGHKDIAYLLIQNCGLELCKLSDQRGKTSLHWAIQEGHEDIARLLIQKGGSELYKLPDNEGGTALHWAARKGYREIVQLLIQKGGFELYKLPDNEGQTALHYAAIRGRKDIVDLFIPNENTELWKKVEDSDKIVYPVMKFSRSGKLLDSALPLSRSFLMSCAKEKAPSQEARRFMREESRLETCFKKIEPTIEDIVKVDGTGSCLFTTGL